MESLSTQTIKDILEASADQKETTPKVAAKQK